MSLEANDGGWGIASLCNRIIESKPSLTDLVKVTVALRHIAATFSAADKCGLAAMLTDLATELDQHGRRDSKLH